MSRSNIIWLIAVVVVGVIGAVVFNWWAGLIAAVVVLAVSEVVQRRARRQRFAARGDEVPSFGSRIKHKK